jgi:hypothetical protein
MKNFKIKIPILLLFPFFFFSYTIAFEEEIIRVLYSNSFTSINDIDFKNVTIIGSLFTETETLTFVDGKHIYPKDDITGVSEVCRISVISIERLTDRPNENALINIGCDGYRYPVHALIVVSVENNRIVASQIGLGAPPDHITIMHENTPPQIVVERDYHFENEPSCCPTGKVLNKYAWNGHRFVQIERQIKNNINECINIKANNSGKSIENIDFKNMFFSLCYRDTYYTFKDGQFVLNEPYHKAKYYISSVDFVSLFNDGEKQALIGILEDETMNNNSNLHNYRMSFLLLKKEASELKTIDFFESICTYDCIANILIKRIEFIETESNPYDKKIFVWNSETEKFHSFQDQY